VRARGSIGRRKKKVGGKTTSRREGRRRLEAKISFSSFSFLSFPVSGENTPLFPVPAALSS
jgi:hypothetical protein